jgi:hypothetical protein
MSTISRSSAPLEKGTRTYGIFLRYLQGEILGRDLGNTQRLLGIVLERNEETGTIKMIQQDLLQDIVELLQQATRRETPLLAGTVFEVGTAHILTLMQ